MLELFAPLEGLQEKSLIPMKVTNISVFEIIVFFSEGGRAGSLGFGLGLAGGGLSRNIVKIEIILFVIGN